MTDGRDRVRRSKAYPFSDPESGYPFYGRWDIWLGSLLTVFPLAGLTTALVPSTAVRVIAVVVAIAVAAETSRAALGVSRADRVHRRVVAEAISEETGTEIAVSRLATLYGTLHHNSGEADHRIPKKVTDTWTADDGSTVTLVMYADETVKAVRKLDDR